MGMIKGNQSTYNLLRQPSTCPYCGKELVTLKFISETQVGFTQTNSSYSVGKGLLGTVLFGSVGAVAGINGKQSQSGMNLYRITAMCMYCYKELQFDSPQSVYDPGRKWSELSEFYKKLLLKEEIWRDMKRYFSNVDVISYSERKKIEEKYIRKYGNSKYDERQMRSLRCEIDSVMRKFLKLDTKNRCYRVVHDA